jgi:hypothetical protein
MVKLDKGWFGLNTFIEWIVLQRYLKLTRWHEPAHVASARIVGRRACVPLIYVRQAIFSPPQHREPLLCHRYSLLFLAVGSENGAVPAPRKASINHAAK